MSAIYWLIVAWAITLGVVGLIWVAAVEIGKWRDRRWQAERPARPTADPEWIAGLYDHPPIYCERSTCCTDNPGCETTAACYHPSACGCRVVQHPAHSTPDMAAKRDLGPIFEAGYERQAQRGRELLEDWAAFDRWLHGGRSS